MMKRFLYLLATLLLAGALTACGTSNNDDNTNADQAEENTADNNDQADNTDDQNGTDDIEEDATNDETDGADASSNDDMKQKMDELDYTDFELEVDYGKNKEYEAEIEQDNGQIEADLEDELNGVDENGVDAFNKIYPNVKKLTIDRNTSKEDAIDQVLDAFDLDPDYKKFEVEITLKDGPKIEFEDKK